MFKNVGEKLKVVAIISLIIGIIASVIIGIVEFIGLQFIVGIITIALGILSSLISAWVLYAIGEIAENSSAILRKIRSSETKINPLVNRNNEKDGTWICSCGARNSNSSSTCNTCFESRRK